MTLELLAPVCTTTESASAAWIRSVCCSAACEPGAFWLAWCSTSVDVLAFAAARASFDWTICGGAAASGAEGAVGPCGAAAGVPDHDHDQTHAHAHGWSETTLTCVPSAAV